MQINFNDAVLMLRDFVKKKERVTQENINTISEILEKFSSSFEGEHLRLLNKLEKRVKSIAVVDTPQKLSNIRQGILPPIDMPDEMWVYLAGFLSGEQHLAMRSVNQRLHQVFDTHEAAQAYLDKRMLKMNKDNFLTLLKAKGALIRHLDLKGIDFSQSDFEKIVEYCPNLESLKIYSSTSIGLENLTNFKKLQSLVLTQKISVNDFEILKKLKSLTLLDLTGSWGFSDEDLIAFKKSLRCKLIKKRCPQSPEYRRKNYGVDYVESQFGLVDKPIFDFYLFECG